MFVLYDGLQRPIDLKLTMTQFKGHCPALFKTARGQRNVLREIYRGFLLVDYTFTPFRGALRPQNVRTCAIYGFNSNSCRAYFLEYQKDTKAARRFLDKLLKSSLADTRPIRRSIKSGGEPARPGSRTGGANPGGRTGSGSGRAAGAGAGTRA